MSVFCVHLISGFGVFVNLFWQLHKPVGEFFLCRLLLLSPQRMHQRRICLYTRVIRLRSMTRTPKESGSRIKTVFMILQVCLCKQAI